MILLVTALILLMIVLFIIVQSYVSKNTRSNTSTIIQEDSVEQTVELSEAFIVLVEKITDDHIMGYDINNEKVFSKVINEAVKVSDAYGKVLPLGQIKAGDIIEVNYQSQKDQVISIGKSSLVHNWSKISGVTVDTEEKLISIGGKSYTYTDELLVVDHNGLRSSISKVGPYDIVSLQAIDDMIWSIKIEEASASLNIAQLPTSNGQIEIDNSRLIMFKDVTEPIKLVPGEHKIVIKMRGYMPITTEITVEANEVYEMILQDAEKAYTVIRPNIVSSNKDYAIEECTIKVGDKTYKYGEEIKVQQDTYKIEINALNHKKRIITVYLENPTWTPTVELTAIEVEDEVVQDEAGATSSTSSATTGNSEETNASADARTITINTDPAGANVYIDGAFKGITPYTLDLEDGTYTILLEKTGYELCSTNILVDGSDNQGSYLYQLKSKE